MFWKQLSLRWRMVLIIIIIPLLLVMPAFILGGAGYRAAYREARVGKAQMAVRQLEQIVRGITPYVTSLYDVSGLDLQMREVPRGEDDLSFAALVLEGGLVVYHSNPALNGTQVLGLDRLTRGEFQRVLPDYGAVYLTVGEVPVPGTFGQSLYIVVGQPLALVDPFWLALLPALGGIVLAALMIVLTQAVLSRVVLQPLERLAEGAAIVGAGDLAYEIPIERADEVGFLAQSFNQMARQVREFVQNLEAQVVERTSALERKSKQLEAANMVTREAAHAQDVLTLLEIAVTAISEYFDLYHAGVFLLDEDREWAVLRAASSEGGRRMLLRRHRLRVGQQGIVGYVSATGLPRIALDVGEDAYWFDNPDLPDTHSEIGLPLKIGDELIGVLDVQSEQTSAFTDDDISNLQLLADQLALAIMNAQAMERMQGAVAELQMLQQDYRRQGWARVMARQRPMAYEYDQVEVYPVPPLPVPDDFYTDATKTHQLVSGGGVTSLMSTISAHDQLVGVVALTDPERTWSREELSLVQSVSEQVGLALENARLFEDAQRTAQQQALINFVLQAAAGTTEPEQALRDIAQVLAQGLGMAVGVFTYLNPESPRVQLQAFLDPAGEQVLSAGSEYALSEDLQIFFRGLTRPELGRMLSTPDNALLAESYDLERVLYVAIRTATAQKGFMAMVQRRDDPPLDPETRALAQNLAGQVAVLLENMSLLEETQQRSGELQSLYEVSLRFAAELDPQELANTIVEQAASVFGADIVGYLEHHPENGSLILVAGTEQLRQAIGMELSADEGLAHRVLQERRPVVLENYQLWDGKVDWIADVGFQFDAVLSVPILGRAGVLGVLDIDAGKRRVAFDDDDVRLAELFAAQAASALENATLYAESADRAQSLQQLYNAGLELVAMLDVQQILDAGSQWALEIFGGDTATIYYLDPDTEQYSVGRAVISPEWLERGPTVLPRPQGMTHTIMQSGEAVLIRDTRADRRIPEMTKEGEARIIYDVGLLSQVAVPLRLGQQMVGVLYVNSVQVGHFEEDDIQLLEFLGTQVATAIQNARLFGQTQQALAVVEVQARYQTRVAQTTSLLTEQGTEALAEVLALLGDAVGVGRTYYFEAHQEDEARFWSLLEAWGAERGETWERFAPTQLETWRLALLKEGVVRERFSTASPEEREFLEALGLKSMLLLAVPGRYPELPNFLGFGDTETERDWGQDEISAVRTVAAALSTTLARERLFDQIQENLAETEALYQAGAELNRVNDYEDVLDVLRRYTILNHPAATNSSLQLFDRPWIGDDAPTWSTVYARWSDVPLERLQDRYPVAAFPSAKVLLRLDAPTFVADLTTDPRVDDNMRAFFVKQLEGKSAIFVPLVVANQKIGYLHAVYREHLEFSEAELRQVMSLAGQAAVVAQNILQLNATEARALRERRIREIVGRIQAAPDVQMVLQTAVRELGRSLGVPRSAIRLGSAHERAAAQKPGTQELTGTPSAEAVEAHEDDTDTS